MSIEASRHDKTYARGRERGRAFLAGGGTAAARAQAKLAARSVGWPIEKLIQEVIAYDRERLDAVPSLTTYPELRGYRDRLEAEDRGMRDAGVSDELIALWRTLGFYTMTRLYEQTGRACDFEMGTEECRTLFVRDSEDGPIHAKNVDGPPRGWKPLPPIPNGTPWPFPYAVTLDGVGSGLHIDEIPPEIFPVDAWELCRTHCETTAAATEFMVRYNYFWADGNLIVYDREGDSMAFEKTRCRVATRKPNRNGMNFISGMGALDPGIREHQRKMRQKFLDQVGRDWDGPEGCFWRESDETYKNMARYVEALPSRPTLEQVHELMSRTDPGGPLCYTGEKSHPDQPDGCLSAVMHIFLPQQRKHIRRQSRDGKPAFLDKPEVIQYGPPSTDTGAS